MLIGIHSSGIKCGDNAPAWYVRVSLVTFYPSDNTILKL